MDGDLKCCLSCPITRVAQIYNGFHVEPIWVIPIIFRLTINILAITIVKYTHCCIQRARVPESQTSVIRTQWEDGAGLHLFRLDKEIAWAYSAYPQTEYPNNPTPPRSAWITLNVRKIRRSTYTLVSTSVGTSLPSLSQWRAFSGSSQRLHLNVLPAASQRSGRSHIHVPAGKRRV